LTSAVIAFVFIAFVFGCLLAYSCLFDNLYYKIKIKKPNKVGARVGVKGGGG